MSIEAEKSQRYLSEQKDKRLNESFAKILNRVGFWDLIVELNSSSQRVELSFLLDSLEQKLNVTIKTINRGSLLQESHCVDIEVRSSGVLLVLNHQDKTGTIKEIETLGKSKIEIGEMLSLAIVKALDQEYSSESFEIPSFPPYNLITKAIIDQNL